MAMNEQKPPNSIEWTRIRRQDGTVMRGFTWNPTAGCLHGCTWKMPDGSVTECYAKTVADKFTTAYPQGFDHHYFHPERLNEPLKLKDPSGIFVGSMADLFGHWTPKEQIEQVIGVMRRANQHTFQTLSKNPIRQPEFNPFPNNVWVGVSLPAGHLMKPEGAARALKSYLGHMERIEAKTRFMSIEPLWFDAAKVFKAYVSEHGRLPFEWVIIGAASKGKQIYQPKPEWVRDLLTIFDSLGIPVFFKGNLKNNSAARPWREEFPVIDDPEPPIRPERGELGDYGWPAEFELLKPAVKESLTQMTFWQPNDGEKESLTSSDLINRTIEERKYNTRLMAAHNAMFERAARGEWLEAWEARIVANRAAMVKERAA